MQPILSSESIRKIQNALKNKKKEIHLSLDLGKTITKIALTEEGPLIENVSIKLPKIRDKDKSCYLIERGKIQKMQYISEVTGEPYKLIPTTGRPLLQISGTSMHKQPFIERIERDKLKGNILDAGTGLGYTAMTLAKTAKHVTTIERDTAVLELQKLNPWSQELFTRKNITLIEGDAPQVIKTLHKDAFDNIVYDAGTPRSSGLFFSTENYAETYRILKRKGKLYHYIPSPQKEQGRDFAQEIMNRLEMLGFILEERNKEDSYCIFEKN